MLNSFKRNNSQNQGADEDDFEESYSKKESFNLTNPRLDTLASWPIHSYLADLPTHSRI